MDDKLKRLIEAELILPMLAKETEMPENIMALATALIEGGCPLKGVLDGFYIYGKRLAEQEDKDSLKELLKDLPIKWEDD